MTCAFQADGAIELYFYGELPADARPRMQEHLRHCAECREALEDLRVIRAALASMPDVAAPPHDDWRRVLAGVTDVARSAPAGGTPDHLPRAARAPAPIRLLPYLAVAATLVIVTISALMVVRNGPGRVPGDAAGTPAAPVAASPAAAVDPALLSVSGQHLQQSKVVILGLATRETNHPDDGNWAFERTLATSLLDDTRLYRRAAEQRGMSGLAGVMRDLELVLLQTSMADREDAASLEHIQQLIRRRDLLAKIGMYETGPLPGRLSNSGS